MKNKFYLVLLFLAFSAWSNQISLEVVDTIVCDTVEQGDTATIYLPFDVIDTFQVSTWTEYSPGNNWFADDSLVYTSDTWSRFSFSQQDISTDQFYLVSQYTPGSGYIKRRVYNYVDRELITCAEVVVYGNTDPYEPNDDSTSAYIISLNDTVSGVQILEDGDLDFFEFDVNDSGLYVFEFWGKNLNILRLELYYQGQKILNYDDEMKNSLSRFF